MKILIIRFSSLGDIFHCMEVPRSIKLKYPQAEIHWITKTEFADIVKTNSYVDKVWSFNRNKGLDAFKHFYRTLSQENYSLIYDAHNNIRSHLIKWPLVILKKVKLITRPKNRIKRFMYFKLNRRNVLPSPFRAMESFLWPLKIMGVRQKCYEAHALNLPVPKVLEKYEYLDEAICIAPGAAHKLKRWPVDSWQKYILNNPNRNFFIIGGPLDTYCKTIASVAPDRCVNLAGKLTWVESMWLINQCKILIAGDTGAMHIADFLGKYNIGLMGPSAFGFPSRPKSKSISKDLPCQPCSKDGSGGCSNRVFQKCLQSITTEDINSYVRLIEKELQP